MWRDVSDWAKRRPLTLRLADRLGRSRGRLRLLDRLSRPAAARLVPDLSDWESRTCSAVWIGHATVLLRLGGLTILTDPVFSSRVGVGLGLITAGPQRHQAPALTLEELPAVDLVLVSHAHFDHLDRPTLARLPKQTPVITSWHNADLISDLGFRSVKEMRWQESCRVGAVTITSCKVRHWGARTFHDPYRGFCAFLLESATHRVLYGGDTAHHEYFRPLGEVDLAILGIGAYDPYIQAHATPEQALEMADHVRAAHVFPMHHSTFRLSHEPMGEPMQRLLAATPDERRIVVREVGGQWVG